MHKVKINNEIIIEVSNFDDLTNKEKPYYYSQSQRYALCPTCGSIVNIIGSIGNSLQSTKNHHAFASHLGAIPKIVDTEGLIFKSNYKNCPAYQGNKGNWQGIYRENTAEKKNQDLENYINNHGQMIAKEMSELTGVKFYNHDSTNSLYSSVVESFIDNRGLYTNLFYPDFVSRQILSVAGAVNFWGYIISDSSSLSTIKSSKLDNVLENVQFKTPNVRFIVTLDDINSPKFLLVKLIYPTEELIIGKIPANPL